MTDYKSNNTNMMKNESTQFQSRIVLFLYITAMLVLYALVCTLSGHPNWILGVFAQNTSSDLLGETWRSLGSQLNVVQLLFEVTTDEMIPKEVLVGIANDLPKTMQFTCINGLFQRLVPKKDRLAATLFFVAGYLLQALIAVSWELCSEAGVTFESVMLSWHEFYSENIIAVGFVMFAMLLLSYIAKCCGHGLEEFLQRHSETTSSIYNVFCVEMLRAILLITFFGLTLQVMESVGSLLGINLTGWIVEFLKTCWFLLLNYWLNKIVDVFVEIFGFGKNTFAQDIFCASLSSIVLLVCLGLYFVA